MESSAGTEDIATVLRVAAEMGLDAHAVHRRHYALLEVVAAYDPSTMEALRRCHGVADVRSPRPYKLASRYEHPDDTIVDAGGVPVGGEGVVVAGGPYRIESLAQTRAVAKCVVRNGAHFLQGNAFLEDSSPYTFRGSGLKGLETLARASKELALPLISSAVDQDSMDLVARYADVVRIGAGHMQNFPLLRAAGRLRKPVLLERGAAATVEELLLAAEYIMMGGNRQLILCERGIRTYSDHDPAMLDLSMVPAVKRLSHLPVVVDVSQSASKREKTLPLARAAVACGADGVLVTLHHPSRMEPPQALLPESFGLLMHDTRALASVLGRTTAPQVVPRRMPRGGAIPKKKAARG